MLLRGPVFMSSRRLSDIFNSRLTVDRGRTRYDFLPSSSSSRSGSPKGPHGTWRSCCHVFSMCRRMKILLLVFALLATASVAALTYVLNYSLPPLYGRFHQAELALPQHDVSLPLPEGAHGRYLWVANHASSEFRSCGVMKRRDARDGLHRKLNRMRLGQRDAGDVFERVSGVQDK